MKTAIDANASMSKLVMISRYSILDDSVIHGVQRRVWLLFHKWQSPSKSLGSMKGDRYIPAATIERHITLQRNTIALRGIAISNRLSDFLIRSTMIAP